MRIVTALIVTLAAGQALAETRFMNLSYETVAGRRVDGVSGGYWMFHKDGRFTGRNAKGKPFSMRWEIVGPNLIKVSGPRRIRHISTFIDKGSQFMRWTPGDEGRRPFEDRIRTITAVE